MVLKLPFLMTSTLLWLYRMKIPDVATSYCSVTCHQFQRTERTALYEFVTHSGTVDKWLSLASFVTTDQRSMGIGKKYKVIMDQTILHFNVTDHIAGEYLALEASMNVLHPRLELWFFAHPLATDDDRSGSSRVELPPQSYLSPASSSSSSAASAASAASASSGVVELPPQTNHDYDTGQESAGWRGTVTTDWIANGISGGVEHHRHYHRRHHHHHHHHQHELRQGARQHHSSLELRFYFKHNSFLFQVIKNPFYRGDAFWCHVFFAYPWITDASNFAASFSKITSAFGADFEQHGFVRSIGWRTLGRKFLKKVIKSFSRERFCFISCAILVRIGETSVSNGRRNYYFRIIKLLLL
ncbi:uncharacterized protein LOC131434571 isoform X2 [Malaya genurostris]|nr:uncharacterized protein LOC131434571 isoform X2 [Malaya genurostris]